MDEYNIPDTHTLKARYLDAVVLMFVTVFVIGCAIRVYGFAKFGYAMIVLFGVACYCVGFVLGHASTPKYSKYARDVFFHTCCVALATYAALELYVGFALSIDSANQIRVVEVDNLGTFGIFALITLSTVVVFVVRRLYTSF